MKKSQESRHKDRKRLQRAPAREAVADRQPASHKDVHQEIDKSAAILTTRGAARIRSGHLWIYRSDLGQRPAVESGAVVRVVDSRNRFLGHAHFGAESEISLRIISRKADEKIDRQFWRDRLLAAAAWREKVVSESDCCRIVHSEGDGLSGLIIDRYANSFVIQTLTRGMDRLKDLWVELLIENFAPDIIVERNDARVRQLEGLPLISQVLHYAGNGTPQTTVTVTENGLRFGVDLLEGQKTGAFLDQRENRAAARDCARGRALDCFSFHGSFALHLAANCEQVTALDISPTAIERARLNARLNSLTNIEFEETNVFDRLRALDDAGERFDTIVLDPPAFARNRAALDGAIRGYKEINLRALRLLNPGGILITCSCSYHIGEDLFLSILAEAAADSGCAVQIVERRTQSRDHPVLLTVPETGYLKCVILRVVGR